MWRRTFRRKAELEGKKARSEGAGSRTIPSKGVAGGAVSLKGVPVNSWLCALTPVAVQQVSSSKHEYEVRSSSK